MSTDPNEDPKGGGTTGGPSPEPEIYFYLVTLTAFGWAQDYDSTIHNDHGRVSRFVRSLKGQCVLYTVPGPYDWISMVTNVSGSDAIKIQQYIEETHYAKAILLPGKIDPK
jgi:hypothetical protein